LLCTAGGLIVAAMSTVEYNYFVARVNRFVLRVQVAGTALVEYILDAQSNRAAAESDESDEPGRSATAFADRGST
jgi:hypothetical protein